MSEAAVDFGAILAAEMTADAATAGFATAEAPAPVAPQAPVRVAVQETDTPATEAVTVDDPVIDLDPELPDEILGLLEPDEDDDDFTVEPAAVDPTNPDDWTDPTEVAKLRAENERLRKKAEHAETQRLQASKPKWMAEAAKFFPLSDPASIDAPSRKEFMRQAAKQHDALKPALNKLRAGLEQERAKIKAELEAEAQQAWGKPLTGPGNVPVEAGDKAAKLKAARATGNLEKVIGVMIGNT